MQLHSARRTPCVLWPFWLRLCRVGAEREQAAARAEAEAKRRREEAEIEAKKAAATPEPEIVTFAPTLMAADEKNEVAPDNRYKGKTLEVKGVVEKIGKDILNTAYVALSSESQALFFSVQCTFPKARENDLTDLKPGQKVKITGKCMGKLGNVLLDNCYLKTQYTSRGQE